MTATRAKYRAVKTECAAGHLHDSKIEARRCDDLHALVAAGRISDLELQPRFDVRVNGDLICKYLADFAWRQDDLRVVEDVKGVTTRIFNLKKKLVEATHPGVVITLYPPRTRKKRAAKK